MLRTERLTLRPWRLSDLPDLNAIFGDAEVMAFSDHGVLDRQAQLAWLTKAVENTGDKVLSLAIAGHDEPRAMGYISLSPDPQRIDAGDAEIGFRLAQNAWGKGYATEAAVAMIAHARTLPNVVRIVAVVDPHNERSVHVLQKIGMTYVRDIMFDSYDHPDHLYARPVAL